MDAQRPIQTGTDTNTHSFGALCRSTMSKNQKNTMWFFDVRNIVIEENQKKNQFTLLLLVLLFT